MIPRSKAFFHRRTPRRDIRDGQGLHRGAGAV